ncbi:hypothetical protein QC762_0002780 [Podospora pseudocomata]|uniref:Prion-inhibition and propagation HeLo domain-containing protein n=1 Tax=Podospora pseudocomata TaxID=2093779 RepID=A0ABR0GT68_9PEZI|nr:hypothetical protein QC762_0002780 [Podospora pseudocomata]
MTGVVEGIEAVSGLAGLTGSQIEDEESLKSSGSFQLDELEEQLAAVTFQAVADLFEQCKKLCHHERKSKEQRRPQCHRERGQPIWHGWPELEPHAPLPSWKNARHRRRPQNKVSVAQRVKFAIYKKEHLEKFIKDINDLIDELYKIHEPPVEEQKELGKEELAKFLEVLKELDVASDRDPVIRSAVQNILKQEASRTSFNLAV